MLPLALYALALGTFALGTTELVIVGLLPEVSSDLGVSIPTAGLLVTGFALSVVVGSTARSFPSRNPPAVACAGNFRGEGQFPSRAKERPATISRSAR